MDFFGAIILGIVEGATEFIPVSSSGHLIVVREFLNLEEGGLAFDAVLQLSAALALVVYFRNDIWQLCRTFLRVSMGSSSDSHNKTLLSAIILGTIPAIIVGLLLEDYMETIFRNSYLVAVMLILGSILFWVADKYSKKDKVLSLGRGVVIGLFQCLALVPGVSRSGATISGGLLVGLRQDEAVRFSFLLSIPVILGAGIKKLFEIQGSVLMGDLGVALILGSLVAFITGLCSIHFLIKYLRNNNLTFFIWYRVILAAFIFLLI